MKADVAIFDPITIQDTTFEKPHSYVEGVMFLIVKRQAVFENGG